MTVEMTATKEYLHLIEKLKLENGISYKILAEKSGVKEHKVKAIRGGNSSADIVMVRKLKAAYADILGITQETQKEEAAKRLEKLDEYERQLKELRDWNREMQQQLSDAHNRLLEKDKIIVELARGKI